METQKPSFTIRFFKPADAGGEDLDDALHVYNASISPALKTRTNEIRHKVAHPWEPEGTFHFAALYRHRRVVGFAMFGHYPEARLLVIDHMAIEDGSRGGAAFTIFAQALLDYVHDRSMEFDFVAAELERDDASADAQTGGRPLVRLLGQFGFGEVHAAYAIADMDAGRAPPHPGILMLRTQPKLHRIRRRELIDVHRAILFDHYLPWCRSFLGDGVEGYRAYLRSLHDAFAAGLADDVVEVNGPERDVLSGGADPARVGGREVRAAVHAALFVIVSAAVSFELYLAGAGIAKSAVVALALLTVYAALVSISEGKAADVLDKVLVKLPGGTRRSRYLPPPRTRAPSRGGGRKGRGGSRGPGP